MKNHIAILIGALALCSCEDYLTQENPNKIESEYYFTDESSLEIYTNGFIRSFATAIKSFVDGDKNADTHSWDGQAAYFAADLAYYLDKRARGADRCVHMLGADHHGYIGRMYACLLYTSDAADEL